MADKNLLEQMLEHLVNEDQEKAEELFHQYVVEKSREIYDNLIEEEVDEELDEESKEDDEDEAVEEAAKSDDDDEDDDEEMEESIEELDVEDLDEADPTDDLAGEVSDEMDGEEGDMDMDMDAEEKDEEELFQDLDDIVDQLQAKFDELKGDDEGDMDDMDMGDEEGEDDEEMKDEFDAELATVREYVEKITGGHGAEKKGAGEAAGTVTSSVVAGKNDMGGTAGNLNQAEEAKGGSESGLTNNKPQDMNTGNINKVGGSKESERMQKDSAGHGAEKSGSSESADNKDSIFRGRR